MLKELEKEISEISLELEKHMRNYGKLYIKEQLLKKGYINFKSEEDLDEIIDKVFGDYITDISTVFYEGLFGSSLYMDIDEFLKNGVIK